MPLYTTPDGRYTVAWQTPGEGDGNSVLYDRGPDLAIPYPGTPIWDRWSYEASLGAPPSPPPVAPPVLHPPIGESDGSVAASIGGGVIRVTDERDGEFINRGYSYWPQAWITGNLVYVFAGHRDQQPRFFRVDLTTRSIERLGPLLGERYRGEGEGLYWNHGWVYYIRGMELRRASPFAENDELVFSVEGRYSLLCDLWQAHSSDNGETHSATVRKVLGNGDTEKMGTVVYWQSDQKFFPARGALDESQVDASGGWVIIKEDERNRVIELGTSITQTISNEQGALGHSDCGAAFIVGEDDQRGECVYYDLRKPMVPERRRTLPESRP